MARKKEYWNEWNIIDETMGIEPTDDEVAIIGDDPDEYHAIPEGCEACGNPDYPKCKYSCPMFDI